MMKLIYSYLFIFLAVTLLSACPGGGGGGDDGSATVVNNPAPPETKELISGGQLTRSFAATGALVQGNKVFCTASLVAPNLALTAAHCVHQLTAGEFHFLIGVRTQDGARYSISKVAVHPNWNGIVTSGSDLAVLALTVSVNNVEPIRLDLQDPGSYVNQQTSLVGYGRSFDESFGGIRRKAIVQIRGTSPQTIDFVFDGSGACQGDSGGPALIEGTDQIWRQLGITSWGDPQCLSDYHYQRLDIYASWLQAQGVPIARSSNSQFCAIDGVCDGGCEEDEDCWSIVCPGGTCSASNNICVADSFCDSQCGNADPDCAVNVDYCAVYGLYGNGICDISCPLRDLDCDAQINSCFPAFWVIDAFGTCNYLDPAGRTCFIGPSFYDPYFGPYCP